MVTVLSFPFPVICWFDELEKVVGGMQRNGNVLL